MKPLLVLTHTEAKQFFLKQKSYCNIDLPEYFVFEQLLNALSQSMCILSNSQLKSAKQLDKVNHTLFYNKDGKFAWRPLQLINPALYVFLVHKITTEVNWKFIVEKFEKFQANPQIKCCSIPIVSDGKENSDKACSVTNWWNRIEQQSLELALKYEYMLNTDITDCYGSIYTHSITWALHDKDTVKEIVARKKQKPTIYIGNDIDTILQSMHYAQTNGIPQGSFLMDFIAEMVLGYADMLFSEKIKDESIYDYQILRYRDDYRIFTNSQEDAAKIAKLLTEMLIELNLRLNSGKTFQSSDIIQDTIKPDKLYWISAKRGERTLQKTLLLIHSLAQKYPNSGSVVRALSDFQKRLYNKKETTIKKENISVLISIIVDIALKNPKTYPMATAILSKLLSSFEENEEIRKIIGYIELKFSKTPNVGHLQIWLQRLILKIDENKDFAELLCKKVINENIDLWNIDWLGSNIQSIFKQNSIIDEIYIQNMKSVIKPEEVQLFQNEQYL
jgi:hypothetical protein